MGSLGQKLSSRDLHVAWLDYQESRDHEARNRLVLHYDSLVRVVAGKVHAGLPRSVDREDLVSYGMFGLLDAIEKYDPTKNVKFTTYAVTRIRGAIIDEIRALDWIPRTIRARAREVDRAEAELHSRLGRPATDLELTVHLGVSPADLHRLRSQVDAAYTESLDDGIVGDDVRGSGRGIGSPEEIFEVGQVATLVAGVIDSLPSRSKTILVLYYIHEKTLAEIGEILGVTESRVCQLQSKLLQSLHIGFSEGSLAA